MFLLLTRYHYWSDNIRRKGRVRNNTKEKEDKREEDKVGKETRALQAPCGSEANGYSGEISR